MDVRDLVANLADAQRRITALEQEISRMRTVVNGNRRVLRTLTDQSAQGFTIFDMATSYPWLRTEEEL
jgi:hypothetical protein